MGAAEPLATEAVTDRHALPAASTAPALLRRVGRYELYGAIAKGGMATVHLGRLCGDEGFVKLVAIKRLHPEYARDDDFVRSFKHEAALASRIRHPNVASTLDVVSEDGELFVVMEYIEGEPLSSLLRCPEEDTKVFESGETPTPMSRDRLRTDVPLGIACALIRDLLHGLHAAHEAKDARRNPLHIVHRDVSPQNALVGIDGSVRVLDFGIAKAADDATNTEKGTVKGKIAYMAPEQIYGEEVDRRVDVYAAGVLLWELLVGERLFGGQGRRQALGLVLNKVVDPPGLLRPTIPPELDDVVMRALERDREERFDSALAMATELTKIAPMATHPDIAGWVTRRAGARLERREQLIYAIERLPVETTAAAEAGPQRKSRRKLWLGAGIGAVLTAGTVAGMASSPDPLVLRPTRAGWSPTTELPVLPPGPSAGPPLAQPAPAPPKAPPAPIVSQTAAPRSPLPAEPVAPPKALPVRPRPAPTPSPRANCNPPYRIDANGHKLYKRECF